MKNYQTFDQFLNEGKIIYKRGYTDLHPAKSTNEKAAIRNKVLGAIQDGILTEDELNNVIKETGAHGRWVSRNSHYFKMTENGIRLSSYGMRIWERVKNAGAINEGNGFLFALKEAREKGLTEFEYNGKKFQVREKKVTEAASVPSNVMDFAQRKGPAATSLVKKAATWAEKAGKRITGGTAIGKNYSTIILDMKYQGAEIYINLDDETIELFGEEVTDAKSFQRVLHDEANESVVDENIRPDQMEQVAKDLAYSMPNHSKPDEDGKFSAEQVQKAFKYIPDLKHVKDKKDIQTIVDKVLAIVNESEQLNEYTENVFKPTVLDRRNSLDEKFFAKLMPKTAKTTDEAMERIWEFEGGKMFLHLQSFVVMPNGNAKDRPTYRLHQQQYWLSGEEVNTTLLTVIDITDGQTESLGSIWVDTNVFLSEYKIVFELVKSSS
jgi:hypothetical protein